jgi:hypothetical protein
MESELQGAPYLRKPNNIIYKTLKILKLINLF